MAWIYVHYHGRDHGRDRDRGNFGRGSGGDKGGGGLHTRMLSPGNNNKEGGQGQGMKVISIDDPTSADRKRPPAHKIVKNGTPQKETVIRMTRDRSGSGNPNGNHSGSGPSSGGTGSGAGFGSRQNSRDKDNDRERGSNGSRSKGPSKGGFSNSRKQFAFPQKKEMIYNNLLKENNGN